MTLHEFLDIAFGADGVEVLTDRMNAGADVNALAGTFAEAPLHVAARRRRLDACRVLLEHGADINARNGGGKTAYAHSIRRRFDEIVELLNVYGADRALTPADEFAVAVVEGNLDEARRLLAAQPGIARTGNPEEDRLLADVAGRPATEPVRLLIDAGADLNARGLDDGTPLHMAAWFGQPANAHQLIDAGAPLEVFDSVHASSPLGWAVHGARYSGDAEPRLDDYASIVRMLLDAGAVMRYPDDDSDAYRERLLNDAPPVIAAILRG
ncbi:MAG: ankyrin repeat domain-containing protein [Planctomycetota bacterium]